LGDSASSDVQWVSVAALLIGAAVSVEAAGRLVSAVITSWSNREVRDLADPDVGAVEPLSPRRRWEFEQELRVAERREEKARALAFMAGAVALAFCGDQSFERSPDRPLQP